MSPQTHPDVHEFACGGPVTATVRVGGGAVTLTAEDAPVAVVAISPYDDSEASRTAAAETKIEFKDDRLRVETPELSGGWTFRRTGRVRVDLRLPVDSHLKAHVGSADVHAQGRLGTAVVHTGSGDTYVAETAGELTVDSGSGDVRADSVGGQLRVRTGSGDISATTVAGPVVAQVASGDIDIEAAAGPVKATTASGDVRIAYAHGDQVRINAASGDVSVGVPAATLVWLDLSTLSGTTTSDLEMTGAAPVGGAQLNLQVRTLSGDIDVHRVSGSVRVTGGQT